VKAAIRDGFLYTSYSPNQVVLGTLERHVAAHGLSPDLRGAIEGLLARMKAWLCRRPMPRARKLLNGVEALLAHQSGDRASIPAFKPRPMRGAGRCREAGALPADERMRLTALLALAAKGGAGAKPAKGWLKSAAQAVDQPDRRCSPSFCSRRSSARESFQIAPTTRTRFVARLAGGVGGARGRGATPRDLRADLPDVLRRISPTARWCSAMPRSMRSRCCPAWPASAASRACGRRLKRRVRSRPSTRRCRARRGRGVTPGELEEIGLPDYGFAVDGTLAITVGPATAVLAIRRSGTRWT
jgi:hypothetical protein